MRSESNHKLEQLHFEAKIERLLREKDQDYQSWTELERLTERILKLRFWGVQLEVRRWVAQ